MKTRLFLVLALLLSVSLACNFLTGGNEAPPPAPTAAQGNAPQSGGEAAAPTTAPPAAPTAAPANPTAEQPSQPAGNASEWGDVTIFAQSYKMRIYSVWQPDNGEAEATDVLIEHTTDPQAEHMSITSPDGDMEIVQIGNDSWMCFGGDCIYSQGEDQSAGLLEDEESPADFFTNPDVQLEEAGRETINGFKTTHYNVILPPEAIQGIAEGEMSNLQSEVWVTDAGKYPPFVIRWTATWDEVRDGVNGSGSLEYEVLEVDTDLAISPPEGAESGGESGSGGQETGGAAGMPSYPNAQVVASMSGYSMMSTADDPQTVSDYYVSTLPDQGWTLQSNDALGDMHIQTWAKEGKTLSITVMPSDDGTTSIMMTLE